MSSSATTTSGSRTGRAARVVRTMLHGISQIFFQTNAWSGLLILLAFAVADAAMALLVLLGTAASTLAGRLCRAPEAAIDAGMHGFCGALVGAAAYAALGSGLLGVAAALVGGLVCGPVTALLGALFASRPLRGFGLPVTTAPFCLVAGVMLWVTSPWRAGPAELSEVDEPILREYGHAVVTNVSQVVLVDSVVAGLLILAALFLAGWQVGAAALLGSVVEAVVAWATDEPLVSTFHGLQGYSGVLTAIALATVFLRGRWLPWLVALAGVLVSVPIAHVLEDSPIPVYTWPFILATWIMLVVVRFVPAVRRA